LLLTIVSTRDPASRLNVGLFGSASITVSRLNLLSQMSGLVATANFVVKARYVT
jgi:hypothetical protein